MIEVRGEVKMKVPFSIMLNMTEEEFEALKSFQQDKLIDEKIIWYDAMQSADVEEFDIWDYQEVE